MRGLKDAALDQPDLFSQAFADGRAGAESLPPSTPLHEVVQTPMSFVRDEFARRGVRTARDLQDESRSPDGERVMAAGIVLVRQRPGTAAGIVFITIEDETGTTNFVVHPKTYELRRA